MASPHVAGLAAYIISQQDEELPAKEIKNKILELATRNVLSDVGSGSPNLLIYNDAETA